MRTVPSVAVPTSAPVRFDLQGTFDVGGIIFYNASPNTLIVATLDGQQVTCPANYWVKIVPSATHIFDGALLVTAQTQFASTAQSAVMWADVYAPGEPMPAGDSGPLPNQMTASNQQPRIQVVPATPANTYVLSGNIVQGGGDLIIQSGIVATWAQCAGNSARAYVYSHSVSFSGAMTTAGQQTVLLLTLAVRQLNNANGFVADTPVDKTIAGYFFGATSPIYARPFGGAPAVVSFTKQPTAVSFEFVLIVHEVVIQPALASIGVFWNATADIDLRDAHVIPNVPGPGGGVNGISLGSQYTGTVW